MHPSSQALSHLLHKDRLPLWARPYAVATWEEQVSTDNFTAYLICQSVCHIRSYNLLKSRNEMSVESPERDSWIGQFHGGDV